MLSYPDPVLRSGYYSAPGSRAATLEAELADALQTGEVEVVFQPQYRLSHGGIYGAEALARWRHPSLGVIGANELFMAAERAQCVAELSNHIFKLALAHATLWPRGLALSLNATPEELVEPRFVEKLAALVAWSRFAPERVTVEITEDVLLADLEAAAEATHRLKTLGFRVALDDFGAGFCNFRYLKQLSLDAIKLDRSMVEGVVRDERDKAILRGIVAMARALSLEVVAEGIETGGQLAVIVEEGCDIYQGFLRAAPMAPETFLQLVKS